MNGSLPRSSSGGSAATTGSAPNLTRIGGRRSSNRDASTDSGTQSWTNGWHVGSYSVCDKNMGLDKPYIYIYIYIHIYIYNPFSNTTGR